jgi:hypothetical protein
LDSSSIPLPSFSPGWNERRWIIKQGPSFLWQGLHEKLQRTAAAHKRIYIVAGDSGNLLPHFKSRIALVPLISNYPRGGAWHDPPG